MVQGKRAIPKGPANRQRSGKPGASFGPQKTEQQKKKRSKLTSVKNQIRAVKRLLAKGGLAPKVVAEQQRRLEQLTDTQEEHQKADKQRKYAARYHKVRFFERVKIERQISQLKRQPAPADGEAAAKRDTQLASLQDDLTYVTHFPKEEKYVSLLRQAEDPEAQAALDAQRVRLRALARVHAADAALVAEPNEGRPTGSASQAFDQAADSDEQDDFFLASDDEGPGASAAGLAGGLSDVAAFERAADAAEAAEFAGSKGKGGKQRQRPLGMVAGGKSDAAKQPNVQPQKQQFAKAVQKNEQHVKRQRQQPSADRRQPPADIAWHNRQSHTPAALASGSPAAQHRRSAPHAAMQHQQQRHQAARVPSEKKRSNPMPRQAKAEPKPGPAPATALTDPGQPKPGQPVRKRAEGGRKRKKRG